MDLIDWRAVGFGSLWIVGLSLNLSAVGLAEYQRSQTGQRFRDLWALPNYQLTTNLGWMLFCFGLIGNASSLWEEGIWGALAAAFLIFAVQARRNRPV